MRVHHPERFPADGPVVVAGNHVGLIDGPLMAIFAPRPVHALTKQEMFQGRAGRFLRVSGQIRLDRDNTDPDAVRTALRVLRLGGAVGVDCALAKVDAAVADALETGGAVGVGGAVHRRDAGARNRLALLSGGTVGVAGAASRCDAEVVHAGFAGAAIGVAAAVPREDAAAADADLARDGAVDVGDAGRRARFAEARDAALILRAVQIHLALVGRDAAPRFADEAVGAIDAIATVDELAAEVDAHLAGAAVAVGPAVADEETLAVEADLCRAAVDVEVARVSRQARPISADVADGAVAVGSAGVVRNARRAAVGAEHAALAGRAILVAVADFVGQAFAALRAERARRAIHRVAAAIGWDAHVVAALFAARAVIVKVAERELAEPIVAGASLAAVAVGPTLRRDAEGVTTHGVARAIFAVVALAEELADALRRADEQLGAVRVAAAPILGDAAIVDARLTGLAVVIVGALRRKLHADVVGTEKAHRTVRVVVAIDARFALVVDADTARTAIAVLAALHGHTLAVFTDRGADEGGIVAIFVSLALRRHALARFTAVAGGTIGVRSAGARLDAGAIVADFVVFAVSVFSADRWRRFAHALETRLTLCAVRRVRARCRLHDRARVRDAGPRLAVAVRRAALGEGRATAAGAEQEDKQQDAGDEEARTAHG